MMLHQLDCLYFEIPLKKLHLRPRQDQDQRMSGGGEGTSRAPPCQHPASDPYFHIGE